MIPEPGCSCELAEDQSQGPIPGSPNLLTLNLWGEETMNHLRESSPDGVIDWLVLGENAVFFQTEYLPS